MPEKLSFLQKKYAEKYVQEDGVMLQSMIQRVLAFAEQYLQEHPQYAISTCRMTSWLTDSLESMIRKGSLLRSA